eukprot:GCRY01001759.1.p1 GENE.GCRY01001759.1~~GCRY01001759.1.p1  ORF type:complete len:172 (+),score=41.31 GCRY01001759.1:144-659(+)
MAFQNHFYFMDRMFDRMTQDLFGNDPFFNGSTLTNGTSELISEGEEPQVSYSSSCTRTGPQGTKQVSTAVRENGIIRMVIERSLGDGRCKRTTIERNEKTREEKQTHECINFDPEDAVKFEAEWNQKANAEKLHWRQPRVGGPEQPHMPAALLEHDSDSDDGNKLVFDGLK